MQKPTSRLLFSIVVWTLLAANAAAQPVKHQVTGLFAPERESDLRAVFEKIPQIKLAAIDFKNAEVTLDYDTTQVFPNTKPAQIVEKLDNLVKAASNHTFGVKSLRTVPREKLTQIEIPAFGLDCKACCLAAYEAIYRIDGVELATASFRLHRVTALFDPVKTDRAKLEAALKQRGVRLTPP